MSARKKSPLNNAYINIDGGKGGPHTQRVTGLLSEHLGRAIELGRDSVAIEIAKQLGDTAGVKGVTVTACTFGRP